MPTTSGGSNEKVSGKENGRLLGGLHAKQRKDSIEILLVGELDAQLALALADGDVDLRVETVAESFGDLDELRRDS